VSQFISVKPSDKKGQEDFLEDNVARTDTSMCEEEDVANEKDGARLKINFDTAEDEEERRNQNQKRSLLCRSKSEVQIQP